MKIKIMIKNYIKCTASWIINLIFPPVCLKCGSYCFDSCSVCADCFSSLSFVSSPYCACCGKPLDSIANQWGFCPYCQAMGKRYFNKARFSLVYDSASSPLILALKYADKMALAPLFAKWMLNAGVDFWDKADFIVSVPLHKSRLIKRKYNQSSLLAKQISALTGIKFLPMALQRIRNTSSQGDLSKDKRKKNVQNAFALKCKCDIKGKNVVIIDDVMTTGATVNECARCLKKAKVGQVFVLTLAAVVKC